MKPIIRYNEIIVFHQDLTTTGSSNKKMLVFFHFTTLYRRAGTKVLRAGTKEGGTQQLIESGSDIKVIYQIPHFNLRKRRKNKKKSSVERN